MQWSSLDAGCCRGFFVVSMPTPKGDLVASVPPNA